LNKWKPISQDDVEMVLDAFSLFNLSKKDEIEVELDPLIVRLGFDGNILRSGQNFHITHVDMNGDCLFNAILQQTNTNNETFKLRKKVALELNKKKDTDKSELLGNIALWQEDNAEALLNFDSLSEEDKISKYIECIKTSPTTVDLVHSERVHWGGQMEITIISEKMQSIRINIIRHNSDTILRIPDDSSDRTDIFIYFNGSHYNIAKKI
jgi:hypothetical protein